MNVLRGVSFRYFLGGSLLGVACFIPFEISQSQRSGKSLLDLYFRRAHLVELAEERAKRQVNEIFLNLDAEKLQQNLPTEDEIQSIFDEKS